MKIPRHKLSTTYLVRRKRAELWKSLLIKVKVKQFLCGPISGPDGSRRLRLSDFETVGISLRAWVDPRTMVRPEGWCHISCVTLCKKKQLFSFRMSISTGGGAYGRLPVRDWGSPSNTRHRESVPPPPPYPTANYFLYQSSLVYLYLYHLSQTIFIKSKYTKFNCNIQQRRRTLSRIKH
jgi:hypothetical protein